MSIARKHIFVDGTPIEAIDWNEELAQLYSFLSGQLSGQLNLKQNSLNVCLIVQNIRSGQLLLVLKKNGSDVFQIFTNQQFKSLVTTVAPINVVSTTKVVGLNSQYLDDKPLSSFVLINTGITEHTFSFYFNPHNPVETVLDTDKTYTFITPALTNGVITKITFFANALHAGNQGTNIFLKKNGVTIASANLGNVVGFTYTSVVLNTAIVENDLITLTLLNTGAIMDYENIGGILEFKQDLVA